MRGVTGAACQLDQLNAVLINRREPTARRSYDLAHELFHLLTWQTMPPKHVESDDMPPTDKNEKRVEQLAENFAAGLLMPTKTINAILANSPPPAGVALAGWIRAVAPQLGLSGPALKWRLLNMGVLKQSQLVGLSDDVLRSNVDEGNITPPARYSKRFVSAISWGIEEGHVSARRVAQLLDSAVDDLRDLFSEHGIAAPFDL